MVVFLINLDIFFLRCVYNTIASLLTFSPLIDDGSFINQDNFVI